MLKAGELDIALSIGYDGAGTVHNPTDGIEELNLFDGSHLPRDARPSTGSRARRGSSSPTSPRTRGSTRRARAPAAPSRSAPCTTPASSRNIVFESDDYNVAQGLVAAGMGVTLLPEMALSNVREDIVVRPLGNQVTHRQIMACLLDGAYRSPATDAMLEVLHESVAEYTTNRTELVAA